MSRVELASVDRFPNLRGMRLLGTGLALAATLTFASEVRASEARPIAIVLCRDTYDASYMARYAQMSTQALVGLAGLVGTAYDTITLEELLARPSAGHRSLWFGACTVVDDAKVAPLVTRLRDHLAGGGTVLLDGPIALYRPPAPGSDDFPWRGSADTAPVLGIEAAGWANVKGARVRTATGAHPLSSRAGWTPRLLTQGLAHGTDLVRPLDPNAAGSHVLLELDDGAIRRPYLVTARASAGRVLAISGFGNDAGAATPFREEAPAGFFDNELLPRLVDAAQWLIAGDGVHVGLHTSHAPVTAVVRLDADRSDDPEATRESLDYLVRLARESGVTTVYAIVSGLAEGAQWRGFQPKLEELVRLGGAVGSHSHLHDYHMSRNLPAAAWDREVRDSLRLIRDRVSTASFRPEVRAFVNPGSEIRWSDYRRFFGEVDSFFTHGFELAVPVTSGISAFDLPTGAAPVALFGDAPVPDVQWLYDPNWKHGVAEATAAQSKIFEWYQRRVGRGVVYDPMWHDYGLGGAKPLHHPEQDPRPFFDAQRAAFARDRIYAPSIDELVDKTHLARDVRVSVSSAREGDREVLVAELDLSRVPSARRRSLAGMGLRIDGGVATGSSASRALASVTIDGASHAAFDGDTVLLPPVTGERLVVRAIRGAPTTPRLTWVSKAPTSITSTAKGVTVTLARAELATRFCFALAAEHVLLGADRYAPAGAEVCGETAAGDATRPRIEARTLGGPHGISVVSATRRIDAFDVAGEVVSISIAAGSSGVIELRTTKPPTRIAVGGTAQTVVTSGDRTTIAVDGVAATSVVVDFGDAPAPQPSDAGSSDAGTSDAGSNDAGSSDAGTSGDASTDEAGRGADPAPPAQESSGCSVAPARVGDAGAPTEARSLGIALLAALVHVARRRSRSRS